jgi:hypothetical protein
VFFLVGAATLTVTAGLVLAALAGQAPVVGGAPGDAGELSEKVKITFTTVPLVQAEVLYQRKRLGIVDAKKRKPLVVERLRDSGPMDVIIRAEGFIPVHTRAYTFTDSKVTVKPTPETEKHTLFGFRQLAPPDAGTDVRPGMPRDAGVAPDAGLRPPLMLIPNRQ